jgi:hypothetical protein
LVDPRQRIDRSQVDASPMARIDWVQVIGAATLIISVGVVFVLLTL